MSPDHKGAEPGGFDHLQLKRFVSIGMGLVLEAPRSWVDSGNEQYFQVQDPGTGTVVTASAYQNPGISLEQWAELRLTAIVQEMPYLRCVRPAYRMPGASGTGIASEYEGVFPSSSDKKRYLVLCLRTDRMVISVSLTALAEVFEQHEAFYRWLFEKKLDVYQVRQL